MIQKKRKGFIQLLPATDLFNGSPIVISSEGKVLCGKIIEKAGSHFNVMIDGKIFEFCSNQLGVIGIDIRFSQMMIRPDQWKRIIEENLMGTYCDYEVWDIITHGKKHVQKVAKLHLPMVVNK